jgi:predicted ArsR family transcriptional regulator
VIASSTLDITGILAAGTLAIVGFFVIPYKRKQAKENFKEKMLTLRTTLLDALTEQFNHEAENAVSRIKDGIAPYTRFINAEQARLEQDVHALTDAQQQIGALQAQVDAVTAPAAENA